MDSSLLKSDLSGVTNAVKQGLSELSRSTDDGYFGTYHGEFFVKPKAAVEPSIPCRDSLKNILCGEKESLIFLEEKGVLSPPKCCPHCFGALRPASTSLQSKQRFVLRCRARNCGKFSQSIMQGSILANCRFAKNKFVEFTYLWLTDCKATTIKKQLGMSSRTVTDWSNYLRETVAADLLNGDCMIGGPGINVELDESLFGKQKYHVCTGDRHRESSSAFFSP